MGGDKSAAGCGKKEGKKEAKESINWRGEGIHGVSFLSIGGRERTFPRGRATPAFSGSKALCMRRLVRRRGGRGSRCLLPGTEEGRGGGWGRKKGANSDGDAHRMIGGPSQRKKTKWKGRKNI